jgi:hypothetical protein
VTDGVLSAYTTPTTPGAKPVVTSNFTIEDDDKSDVEADLLNFAHTLLLTSSDTKSLIEMRSSRVLAAAGLHHRSQLSTPMNASKEGAHLDSAVIGHMNSLTTNYQTASASTVSTMAPLPPPLAAPDQLQISHTSATNKIEENHENKHENQSIRAPSAIEQQATMKEKVGISEKRSNGVEQETTNISSIVGNKEKIMDNFTVQPAEVESTPSAWPRQLSDVARLPLTRASLNDITRVFQELEEELGVQL